jgi:hypothetical protein
MIFPTRPRRNSGEGAIGYLMRLGETHGIPDLAEVLIQVRVPWFELAQGKLIDVVAKATAVESAVLAFDTGTVAVHGVVLRGEHLRRRQWSVHASRRACPECLAADRASGNGGCLPRQWHRAWWDVQPATVCPIHGVRLLCSCPICGSELNFKSTALGKCPNGHPIDVASSDKANNFAGDAYIAGRLGAAPRMLNHVLDEGRLGEAIEALELVGSVALTISRHRSSAKHERHQVLDAGYSVFSGWPTAFDQLLDDLQASSKTGVGNWGAAATYGPLHIGLQELRSGNVLVAMKERLRRHAAKNGISISKPVFGVVVPPTEIYSARQAAKRLGMGFERARQELRLRGQLPVRTRRGTPIRVSSAVVEEIAARRQAEIGVLKLAEHLAIGRSQTRRLVASGMLGEDPSVFRVTDIQKFLQKLSRGAPTKFDRTGVASLPDSCRTARCAIETAIVAILDGRLPVVGIEPDQGLSGIFVRVATLRSIGKASRNVMTYDDAAKALSIKWESLRDLTKVRFIRTCPGGIPIAALEAFRKDFVAGARLAHAAGVRPRVMMKSLTEMGLAPVIAPPRCRQVFYRRSDIVRSRGLRSKFPRVFRYAAGEG